MSGRIGKRQPWPRNSFAIVQLVLQIVDSCAGVIGGIGGPEGVPGAVQLCVCALYAAINTSPRTSDWEAPLPPNLTLVPLKTIVIPLSVILPALPSMVIDFPFVSIVIFLAASSISTLGPLFV